MPFNSLTARRAVAFATDASRWRQENTDDVETPANGPFAPGQLGFLADNGYPTYDFHVEPIDRDKRPYK